MAPRRKKLFWQEVLKLRFRSLIYSQRHYFSLVELMIVISIIAILFSFLFPSLNHALFISRKYSCQSNIKQIHIGMDMYASDFIFYPYVDSRNRASAADRLVQFDYLNGETQVSNTVPIQKTPFICPELEDEVYESSYSRIFTHYSQNTEITGKTFYLDPSTFEVLPTKQDKIVSPDREILLGDCERDHAVTPPHVYLSFNNTAYGAQYAIGAVWVGKSVSLVDWIHKREPNAVHVDGSIKDIKH